MIAEAEFSDDGEMLRFVAPSWCDVEITEHFGITGGNLARLAALDRISAVDALAELLRSIEPSNK